MRRFQTNLVCIKILLLVQWQNLMEKAFPFPNQDQIIQNPMLKEKRDHLLIRVLRIRRVKLEVEDITIKITKAN